MSSVRTPLDRDLRSLREARADDFLSLRERWDRNEAWIRSFVERAVDLAAPLFVQPVAGALTFGEAIRLDGVHVRAHLRQLRRLRAQ